MGRKSKLTDQQWLEIEKRLHAGESQASLAREYKVDKSLISQRFSKRVDKINKLTNQVIETEKEISKLDIFQQNILIGKINHQRLMNDHLEQGSTHAAGVYHQLMLIGKNNLSKVDIDGQGISEEDLRNLMMIGQTANVFSKTPIDMNKASKDKESEVAEVKDKKIVFEVISARAKDTAH